MGLAVDDTSASKIFLGLRQLGAAISVPPSRCSLFGASKFGAYQIGAYQIGACQFGARLFGARLFGARQFGASQYWGRKFRTIFGDYQFSESPCFHIMYIRKFRDANIRIDVPESLVVKVGGLRLFKTNEQLLLWNTTYLNLNKAIFSKSFK